MREHRPRLFHAGNALRPIEDTLLFWRREKSQEKYVEAHGPNCRAPKKLTLVTTSERCASRIFLTLPRTACSAGGAPVSDPAVPALDRAMMPCRRPALQGQCP